MFGTGCFRQAFAAALLSALLAAGQSTYSLQTFAGSDLVGDGGPATAALIAHAEGVAVDPFGGLYVADADGHRVRHISATGAIGTIAGTGHLGFSGDGGPANAALLNTPYGLAADKLGNLYIADLGNGRIRRVTRDGIMSTIAGGGTLPPTLADGHPATDVSLKAPRNITVDSSSNLFFTDFADHRVWQITPAGILFRAAGTGSAAFSGDNGPALSGALNSPAGLAADSTGTLWVADSGNARIRKIWRGLISTVDIPLGVPTGIAIDSDGNLIVADSGNSRVLRITPLLQVTSYGQPARDVSIDGAGNVYSCAGSYVYRRTRAGTISVFAGSGSYAFAGDGGPAMQARLSRPTAATRDPAGNIYIADTGNHRIRKVTADGIVTTVAGTGIASASQLNAPQGVAIDPAGNLWIADTGNNRIRRLDTHGTLQTMSGTAEPGFSGDGGLAVRAQLRSPTGLAADAEGNIYVADTGNHAVRRLSPDGLITSIAGNANRGWAGDGGPAPNASLDSPQAVALDRAGNIFIADMGNQRIRKVAGGMITSFPSDNTVWRAPRGVAVDDSGRLFIADALDHRVFSVDAAGRISTVAGDGLQGFNGESAAALAARLDSPAGLTVDAAGIVYLADSGNDRVRRLVPDSATVTPPALETGTVIFNAASLKPGPVAPSEIVSIFGTALTSDGLSTQVLFDGRPAIVFYTSPNQLNLQVPDTVGAPFTTVQILTGGAVRTHLSVSVAAASPALFTTGSGSGQAIAINEDTSPNNENHPAPRGSVVTLYATGQGVDPMLPVELTIGDFPADLLYASSAPGFVGLMQINARVPGGFAPSGLLPVILKIGSSSSPPGVFIAVR